MINFIEKFDLACHSEAQSAEESICHCSDGRRSAFTLQETLIALTILGVVAVITIPALIQKYIEATRRVKVKKAMAAYEKAVNHMVIDNNISGSIKSWASEVANCGNTNKYFKIISGGDCRFQTSDKVWWDITDIEHPVIAFNEEDLDTVGAEGRFVLLTKNEDSILRINDPNTKSLTTDEQKALEDLYAFVNGEKKSENAIIAEDLGTSDFYNRIGLSDLNETSCREASERANSGTIPVGTAYKDLPITDTQGRITYCYVESNNISYIINYNDDDKEISVKINNGKQGSASNEQFYDYIGNYKYSVNEAKSPIYDEENDEMYRIKTKTFADGRKEITKKYSNRIVTEEYDKDGVLISSNAVFIE